MQEIQRCSNKKLFVSHFVSSKTLSVLKSVVITYFFSYTFELRRAILVFSNGIKKKQLQSVVFTALHDKKYCLRSSKAL